MTQEISLETEKAKTIKAIEKKLLKIAKAIKNAQDQYQASKNFEEVQHLAELVKGHFHRIKRGMTEVNVSDWKKDNEEVKIALDPTLSPQEMLEEMFTKSQKLKKALTPLQELLKKFDQEVNRWQKALETAKNAEDGQILKSLQTSLNLFPEKSIKAAPKKALPYHLFHSSSGLEILVGKSASSNDIVTFQLAHGQDTWLHAHAMSGSHVIIRKKKGVAVDPEALQDALQLALYFSKARIGQGLFEVLVSERKYVSRLPRMPKGKVVVSKHKTMSVELDKPRIEAIKARKR